MNVKARLGDQLRRTVLSSDSQTYDSLLKRLSVLFNRPTLSTTHIVKYQDDEDDWIDMSSDEELQIALSLARQHGYALQLTLHEKTQKDTEEAPKSAPSDPVNDVFEHAADKFMDLVQQWAPVVEQIASAAAAQGFSIEQIAKNLADVQIVDDRAAPAAPKEDKPVHNAWCDHCRSRIAGIRYKCMECPDFDFCSDCHANNRSTHPEHDFLLIERPGKCPMRAPEMPPKEETKTEQPEVVHWAICDNCDERIRGIRHKCTECRDYDLCSGCIAHSATIHPHTFTPIEKPAYFFPGCVRPVEVAAPAPVHVEEPVAAEPVAPVVAEPVAEVVVAAPEPVVEAQPEPVNNNNNASMENLLTQLEEMGFNDRRTNVQILVKNGGDIVNTIVELISEHN